MAFNLFNNIFLLNLAFETAQRTFQRFAILQVDFCQLRLTTFQRIRRANGHTSPRRRGNKTL